MRAAVGSPMDAVKETVLAKVLTQTNLLGLTSHRHDAYYETCPFRQAVSQTVAGEARLS